MRLSRLIERLSNLEENYGDLNLEGEFEEKVTESTYTTNTTSYVEITIDLTITHNTTKEDKE